jgi:hypothetical protein
MRRLVSLALAMLCSAPALAAAEAVYIPVPEPNAYALPPPPPEGGYAMPVSVPEDDLPRHALIATISGVQMRVPDGTGSVERWGEGVSLTITHIETDEDFPGGFEGQATFLESPDGERLYDLGISLIGSGSLKRGIAPFFAAGLDLAASSVDGQASVAIGLHGDLGLHAFVGKHLYLRGSVGWLGAGDGGARAQLGLGWLFNR